MVCCSGCGAAPKLPGNCSESALVQLELLGYWIVADAGRCFKESLCSVREFALTSFWNCSETAPVSIYWTIWNRMPENLSESFWNCSVTALASRLSGLKLATALKLLWELIECHQLQWRADELEIRRWIGAGCGQCVLFKWKHNQSTAPTNRANKSKHHQQQLPLINDNECSFTPTLEYFSAIDSKIPSQCSSITVDLEMSLQKS